MSGEDVFSVLFIDDDADILDVFRRMAERSGEMSLDTAKSAEEGFELLEKNPYDAIIVDYDLPEINGIQFLKILRSRKDITPVIFFTGAGREHTAIEALNNGANYYLKKCDDPPHLQYKQLVTMVQSSVEGNYLGRSVGTARKIIEDMARLMSDPAFVIDNEGTVIAWNEALEKLVGVPASLMVGRKDLCYAEAFFGLKRKTLPDLVLVTDDEIKRQKYMLISRAKNGPVVAVTRGRKPDGKEWTIWTKATPLFDGRGRFIAAAGIIRDVTTTFSDVVIPEDSAAAPAQPGGAPAPSLQPAGGLMDKILGKAGTAYRDGLVLMTRDRNYAGAIAEFDKALGIDENLPHVWSDRGICLRESGDTTAALKSCIRAVELAPENVECLFTLGETLETIGLSNKSDKYLESAVQVFSMVRDLSPNTIDVWNHLGTCHKALGNHDEAVTCAKRVKDISLKGMDTPVPRKRTEYL